MKFYKKLLLPIYSLLIFACIGCEKKASDEIDFGTFEGDLYRNEYFNMEINIPSEWSVQDSEATQQIKSIGQKMLAKDDKNLEAIVKASELQTVNLFVVFEHPLGTPVPFNLNITGVAERVSHMPGIRSGKDYLFHARKLLESAQVDYSFPMEVYPENISGVDFHVMLTEINIKGMIMKQEYYATIMKGYALVFIITYTNDDGRNRLMDILGSLTFG